MRNLKRVLSLAMALVMVLGMMVITTNAADFPDAEEITYTEAVDVMTAIGILKGRTDGTFDPQGTLIRSEAAKIIAFVMMGAEADTYLTGSASVFEDVAADDWAAKYVAFCKNAKIIDGVNAEKTLFNPAGKLTTVQFAKMLLGALGIEGEFTGAGWENNVKEAVGKVATLAATGIKIDATDITREEACELALAAMKHSIAPDVYEVRYTANTQETYEKIGEFNDLFEATMYCKLLANDYAEVAGVGEGYYVQKAPAQDTLLKENYGVVAEDDNDDFGRPGVRYTSLIDEEFDLFFADKALVTYTAPVQPANIAVAYKGYTLSDDNASKIAEADYGKVVEVYATGKVVTDVVVIEELLGKVTKVTEAKGETPRYVTVAGMPFVTESFEKGDVVLYTVADGKIQSMVAVETVVGYIESYNDTLGTVTIGGKVYNYGHDFALTKNFLVPYVFTLYSDGSIAAQAQAQSAAAAVSKDYVYVLATEYQKADNSSMLTSTVAKAKASVIFADGTVGTIDLNIFKDALNSYADSVMLPADDGTVTKKTMAYADSADDATVNRWFAYTANEDGTYTLSVVNGKYAKVLSADKVLVEDTMANLDGKYTTKNTVITHINNTVPSNPVVTTLTGFVGLALDASNDQVLVTYAGPTATTVSAVYAVKQAAIPAATTTYAYAVKAGSEVWNGTEWTFSVEGEQKTFVIAGSQPTAGLKYTLTENATYGFYTISAPVETNTALVTFIDGNQVGLSDGTVKTLFAKVNVYNVDETAEVVGEVKALEVGDVIDYTALGNGQISNIWVYGVEATVEADEDTLAAVAAKVPTGVTILLTEDVNVSAATIALNGVNLDGNGYTITATKDLTAGSGNPVITTVGGKISNLTVDGGYYGIRAVGYMTDNLVLENLTIVNSVRGFTYGAYTVAGVNDKLTATSCVFAGKVSANKNLGSVSFTGCEFVVNDAAANEFGLYTSATFTDCVFEDGYTFDFSGLTTWGDETSAVKLVNCYVAGVKTNIIYDKTGAEVE